MKNFWSVDDCFQGEWKTRPFKAFMHKNYEIDMHTHEFYEINIVMDGHGTHSIENTTIPINRGDVFVIPPFMHHSYRNFGGLDVYHILINTIFFEEHYRDLMAIPGFGKLFIAEPYLRSNSSNKYHLHLSYERLLSVNRDLTRLMDAANENNIACMNIFALNLICVFCLEMNKDNAKNSNTEMLELMEYIQDNLQEKITVKMLSEKFHMSQSSVNRWFRKELNTTPTEYLINCRVKKAKNMIKTTNANLSTIAQECGFYDSSHMNKYIRK